MNSPKICSFFSKNARWYTYVFLKIVFGIWLWSSKIEHTMNLQNTYLDKTLDLILQILECFEYLNILERRVQIFFSIGQFPDCARYLECWMKEETRYNQSNLFLSYISKRNVEALIHQCSSTMEKKIERRTIPFPFHQLHRRFGVHFFMKQIFLRKLLYR